MKSSTQSHISRSMAAVAVPAALLCLSPAAMAKSIRGTVVHLNGRAHSFVLASNAGLLTPVHSSRRPALGLTVVAKVRRLRNGTYALKSMRPVGLRRRVRVHGVVTYVNRGAGVFTVSAEGVSMLVHRGSHRVRIASALPQVGSKVTVSGDIGSQGELEAKTVSSEGTAGAAIDIEGAIIAIDTAKGTLEVSAEDNAKLGKGVIVEVPASLEISKFTVGQEVQLQVSLQPSGNYLLLGSSSDEGTQGAQNQEDQQGQSTDAADQESSAGDKEGSSSDGESSSSDKESSAKDGESTSSDGEGGPSATGSTDGSKTGATGSEGATTAGGSGSGTGKSDS